MNRGGIAEGRMLGVLCRHGAGLQFGVLGHVEEVVRHRGKTLIGAASEILAAEHRHGDFRRRAR
ncbi:hypothetical protein [Rubrimonas sp.]|uniref:hypothetical protein n=1 Tax=Rubrimonas sp. TaxID=2036015 RepID=UPI002FDEC0EA